MSKTRQGRKPLLVFFIFTSGILLIFALKVKSSTEKKDVYQDALKKEEQQNITPVRTVTVNKSEFKDTVYGITGKIDVPKSRLSFEVGGRVLLIGTKKGALVSKGEILAELDKTELILKKKYKENALQGALIELEKAERILAQNKEKAGTGFILESKIKDYELDVKLKNNKVKASRLELEASEVNLAKTEIRAPFDGVIMDRKVEIGEYVSPNQEAFVLLNVSSTYADLEINEKKLSSVHPGQPISLVTNIYKEPFHGVIESIVPALQGKAMVVQARAKVDNNEKKLVPGMFVLGEVTTFFRKEAYVLPIEALNRDKEKTFVYTVDKDNIKAFKKMVSVEYLNRKEAVIGSGLMVGERVIVEALKEIKEGDLIKVDKS